MQRSFSMQQSWVFTVYAGMDSHSFLRLKNKEYEKVGKTQGVKRKDKKKGKEKKIMCDRKRAAISPAFSICGHFQNKHQNCSPCTASTALAMAAGMGGFAYQVSRGAEKA